MASLVARSVSGSVSPAIEVTALGKRYGRKLALDGLSMTVPRGQVFGFLGPNGAGKTTAIRLLLGLSRPTSGGGTILGHPLGSLAARRSIGYLPELFRYQGWLRAREVLQLHCELAGIARPRWAAVIPQALATVGLAGQAEGRVATFSKGMQQRLGLAVALLGEPQLVLLDEPTSALDPVGRHDVREILHRLRERGVTVFLNSHLLSEVEQVCDRAAIVDHGRVLAEGSLAELLGRPRVRIQCSGLDTEQLRRLADRAPFTTDGQWLIFSGLGGSDVPPLVQAIVTAGGQIHAVDPGQQPLEERFLELVGSR